MSRATATNRRTKHEHALSDASRICANRRCAESFEPARKDQRFHSPECRRDAYAATVHACPDCGAMHRHKETRS